MKEANRQLPLPLAWFVRLHRWWCHRRVARRAEAEAQQLTTLVGEDNVPFIRGLCLDIEAETGVYVGPCETMQAILAGVADSGLDMTDCSGGYTEIKQRIKLELTMPRPDALPMIALS